ncbi:NifU family protein [Thermoactinomyces intermedius]|uniref:NifU family protein n=1 Tax=Thermoactinomyces intermedius TaxID=2024 RepID=A0A8I1DFA3_THEIN|nr:NifU family protein [Thermoactinomyces intermedius]MBA4549624.1 NifU family protein [Thermoactinomyces intermedius]MBA4835134.1 NifU family protein [Thermoactinomyces intermedius]MBH8595859.1 NifU family protein [Thermoactinomyces intermedius]RMB00445.1 Fe-S cluster biogenesis protein NfuA [Thermoactinomyces vulgaris]
MSVEERVNEVLGKLRPFIQRDGGDVELVEVEDGIVRVRLLGACGSCPSSTITLKAGIERALMEEVPEVREVEQVL